MEIDYWNKYGHPENLKGNLRKSAIHQDEFYVTYLQETMKQKEGKLDIIYKSE